MELGFLFFRPVLRVTATVFVATTVVACDDWRNSQTNTYEDCLLQSVASVKSDFALATAKAACKGKFPLVFDFEAIAQTAEVRTWDEIVRSPKFSALDEPSISEVKTQYFNETVRPRVPPDYVEEAIAQFDAYTRKVERAVKAAPAASHAGGVPHKPAASEP